MTRYAVIGVCVLCSAGVAADRLPASRPAAGEGFEPLLVRAIQAEKTGQTGEALLLLQRAIGLLQTRLQEAMKATLPKPAEGVPGTERTPWYHRNVDFDEIAFFHGGSLYGQPTPPGLIFAPVPALPPPRPNPPEARQPPVSRVAPAPT